MQTAAKKQMTVAEYLAWERLSPTKHEFLAGDVFAMAGGSEMHSLLASAINREDERRRPPVGTIPGLWMSHLTGRETVAVRGAREMSAISPKTAPGCRRARLRTLPSCLRVTAT